MHVQSPYSVEILSTKTSQSHLGFEMECDTTMIPTTLFSGQKRPHESDNSDNDRELVNLQILLTLELLVIS